MHAEGDVLTLRSTYDHGEIFAGISVRPGLVTIIVKVPVESVYV